MGSFKGKGRSDLFLILTKSGLPNGDFFHFDKISCYVGHGLSHTTI